MLLVYSNVHMLSVNINVYMPSVYSNVYMLSVYTVHTVGEHSSIYAVDVQ